MNTADKCIKIFKGVQLPIGFGIEENERDVICLDPSIGEGRQIVNDNPTIPQLFAILRQFVVPVCAKVNIIIGKLLKKGVTVNDFDLITGYSLLHYSVKAAAINEKAALSSIKQLISKGADPKLCTLYGRMNSLHLAAYFNLDTVAQLLLTSSSKSLVDVNSLCEGLDWGTSLHIAVKNLNKEVIQVLLQNGGNIDLLDNNDRKPLDYLPDVNDSSKSFQKILEIRNMLQNRKDVLLETCKDKNNEVLKVGYTVIYKPKSMNQEKQQFKGTLRYIGKLHFDDREIWVGIELENEVGKNDGSIDNHIYFRCKKNYGIFVKPSKVIRVKY